MNRERIPSASTQWPSSPPIKAHENTWKHSKNQSNAVKSSLEKERSFVIIWQLLERVRLIASVFIRPSKPGKFWLNVPGRLLFASVTLSASLIRFTWRVWWGNVRLHVAERVERSFRPAHRPAPTRLALLPPSPLLFVSPSTWKERPREPLWRQMLSNPSPWHESGVW